MRSVSCSLSLVGILVFTSLNMPALSYLPLEIKKTMQSSDKDRKKHIYRGRGKIPKIMNTVTESNLPMSCKARPFTACNACQTKTMIRVLSQAGRALVACCIYLERMSLERTDKLYVTWFGTFDQERHSTILRNYRNMTNTLLRNRISHNCDGRACRKDQWSYSRKRGELELFYCPKFWTAPDFGKNSKYGICIHELSHKIAKTCDYKYGDFACKRLARYSPSKAKCNADNYQFFAEQVYALYGKPDYALMQRKSRRRR